MDRNHRDKEERGVARNERAPVRGRGRGKKRQETRGQRMFEEKTRVPLEKMPEEEVPWQWKEDSGIAPDVPAQSVPESSGKGRGRGRKKREAHLLGARPKQTTSADSGTGSRFQDGMEKIYCLISWRYVLV